MLHGKNTCFRNLLGKLSIDCRHAGSEISNSCLLEIISLFTIIGILLIVFAYRMSLP